MYAQQEMRYMGLTAPTPKAHPLTEIGVCKTMAQAIYRAMLHAGMTQETLADRVGVSASYMSLILSGKRKTPEDVIRRVVNVTGSLAPIQWMCAQFGGEFYADPVDVRKAQLLQELQALEKAA